MMIAIKNLDGSVSNKIELSSQFNEVYREDLIKRAYLVYLSHNRQPYGTHPDAGKRHSVTLSRKRHDYKSGYGRAMSRIPRKTLLRRGSQFYWYGAKTNSAVGGMRAHPPKAEKIWSEKINVKERRKALRSAIASTLNIDLVKLRNHLLPSDFPFGVVDDIVSIAKTNELRNSLITLGFADDLERATKKKVRAGMGKNRGRRYKTKTSLLIVVKDHSSSVYEAAYNLPGVEVVPVTDLNVSLLSPGNHGIRLVLWTVGALKTLKESNLFY